MRKEGKRGTEKKKGKKGLTKWKLDWELRALFGCNEEEEEEEEEFKLLIEKRRQEENWNTTLRALWPHELLWAFGLF